MVGVLSERDLVGAVALVSPSPIHLGHEGLRIAQEGAHVVPDGRFHLRASNPAQMKHGKEPAFGTAFDG